jgi:hypothetical protein
MFDVGYRISCLQSHFQLRKRYSIFFNEKRNIACSFLKNTEDDLYVDWKRNPKPLTTLTANELVPLTEEYCGEIFSKVCFEHMTIDQLEEAYKNEHVPRNLLCEGLLNSLRMVTISSFSKLWKL